MEGFITGTNISSVLTVILIIFLAWKEFRSGNSHLKDDIVNTYKERLEQVLEELKEARNGRLEDARAMAGIQATMAEKEKQILELKTLNADKNPETISLLKEVEKLFIELKNFMSIMYDAIKSGNTELHKQTGMLERASKKE